MMAPVIKAASYGLNMTLMPAIASSALPRAMLIPCPPQSQKTARVAEPSGLVLFSRQRPIHFPGENAKFGQKLNGSRLIHTDGQSGGRLGMGRGKTGCADDSYAEVTSLRKAPTVSDRAKGQATITFCLRISDCCRS
jgi:hypothetical protein